ncbi:MAG TPA: TlpA disulfide reductase family protein [Chitinophagaceae bacterium]
MRLLIYCFLALLWPGVKSIAQPEATKIKALSVGDTLPNLVLENVLNSSYSKIETAHFDDKLLVLDFFATWCGSCIQALPKLDSLQKEFADDLNVIVVAYERTEKIDTFLNTRLKKLGLNLPFIGSDSILIKLFPHRILPHTVWIKNKKVSAITYSSLITRQNIQTALLDNPLILPVKKDVLDFDKRQRLLVDENGGTYKDLLVQSSVIRNLDGISSKLGSTEEVENGVKRKYYINLSILQLYTIVFPQAASNRVLLKVDNPDKFIFKASEWDLWAKENSFTYEIIYNTAMDERMIKKRILGDLNSFFGLSAAIESKWIDCWILTRSNNAPLSLTTKGGKAEVQLYNKQLPDKYIYNSPLSKLIDALNYQIPGQPINPIVVDETNYVKHVDLELPVADLRDYSALSKALMPYGLKLAKGKRLIKVLVIKDNS